MSQGLQPFQLVEQNLRQAMAFYAGANSAGEARLMPGVFAISCGWNYPVFNSALLTSSVPGADGELGTRLAMAAIYFRALRIGWSCWICHELLDPATLRMLRETCRAHGMDPVLTAPGLYTGKLEPRRHQPFPMTVREVCDEPSRVTFAHLVSLIFDLPFQTTMHVYGPEACWKPDYAAFVGFVDNQPVSVAMICVSDACCGFYSVGTLPGFRRRGYAETVMRFAHETMRNRLHFEACMLQSSTIGRRLYEQMGFREVTRFSVFRTALD